MEKKQTHLRFMTISQRGVKGLRESSVVGSTVDVVKLGLRERKRLGQWMFFVFCGVCFLLGLFRKGLEGELDSDSDPLLVDGEKRSVRHWMRRTSGVRRRRERRRRRRAAAA
ncbi:hypothetical protein Droror1_Dr00018995 [Drosera rotundifolia]